MWFWLVLLILMTNGMSAFGLKVVAAWQLQDTVKFPYLTIWYAAGMATLGLPMLLKGLQIGRKELALGVLMALTSIGGQVAMATALGLGVPGSIVFPVSAGGSLLVVMVAGRLFFGERMNVVSTLGVAVGVLTVILFSVS